VPKLRARCLQMVVAPPPLPHLCPIAFWGGPTKCSWLRFVQRLPRALPSPVLRILGSNPQHLPWSPRVRAPHPPTHVVRHVGCGRRPNRMLYGRRMLLPLSRRLLPVHTFSFVERRKAFGEGRGELSWTSSQVIKAAAEPSGALVFVAWLRPMLSHCDYLLTTHSCEWSAWPIAWCNMGPMHRQSALCSTRRRTRGGLLAIISLV